MLLHCLVLCRITKRCAGIHWKFKQKIITNKTKMYIILMYDVAEHKDKEKR